MNFASSIELINKIYKYKRVKEQKGGFIGGLIIGIAQAFAKVVEFIIWILKPILSVLILPKNKIILTENKFYINNLFIFLYYSIKSGIYISIGFLGGILLSIVGIIYMYANLIKEFFTMESKLNNNNNNN